MYDDPSMSESPQGPELPFAATWGIDNPLLFMGAYMGVAAGAKMLRGGQLRVPFVGKLGSKTSLASQMGRPMRGAGGRFVSGRARFNKMWEMKRKYGANRWMSRMGPKDLMPGGRAARLQSLRGLGGSQVGWGSRAAARKVLYMKAVEKQFGKGMMARVMGHRALTGLMTLSNVSFFAYLGASLIGAVGEMAANWRPSEVINPRRQLETGGPIIDTAAAISMRQRSIQAIHNTQLSTRAALGNEASFMHYE